MSGRRQTAFRVRALCALSLVAAGCATARPVAVDFSEASKSYRHDDYSDVFASWTRHVKLVEDMGTALEIWATFKSWDFRQAYVAKYAKAYDLSDADRQQLAKSQLETAHAVYEIHLVAQSTADRWTDFDRRTSAWRIALVDGTGAELSPTLVKAEKLPEIYEMVFFPTRTLFSRTYTIRFSKPDDGTFVGPQSGRMVLRIASPIGKVEAVWDAKDTSGS